MEQQPEGRILEEREELMVSPTGDGKPILRMAHFLNPSLTSNDNPLHTLSPLSLSSKTSKTQTQKNPLNASFKGWRNPQKKWEIWVDHMCSLHKPLWEKAGIYESIMGSVYSIRKDCELVIKVAEKWCPETNSFVFPFGEATVTLQDMMTLGGYSVLGDSVLTPLPIDRASEETREELLQSRLELVRTSAKRANQGAWMKKFMKSGSRIEHEAFLSLWLSKFVFPSAAGNNSVGNKVLPIAILLAQGTKIALAPAVLASIYRDLSLLRKRSENDVSALTVWAPFQLIQVWIWERFPALGPNPNPLENGEPRLARWHMVKKPNTENVNFAVATSGKCFLWRPYVMAGTNQLIHNLYGETGKWLSVSPRLDEVLESFGRCVRVSELVGLDCIEEYFPHRVAMQFGMDQDIPRKVAFCPKGNPEIAWQHYSRPISDAKLYIPSRCFKSHVTTRYFKWWKKSDGTKGVVKVENEYDSNFPPGFPPKCVGKMANIVPSVPPGFPPKWNIKAEEEVPADFTKGVVKVENDYDSNFPPGFPSKCVRKMANIFPSVPPGFPSERNITTEEEVRFEFPSIPPGFPKRNVSAPGNNESPVTPPNFIAVEKWNYVTSTDTLPPTEFFKKLKGKQMIDPSSSTSDNGVLQSIDLTIIPEKKIAVEGLERVVEDESGSSGGNTSNQGEGTTCSRGDIPGPQLEARIMRLEKLMAQLKAKRLRGWS
ncbi:serine/threonine-protein phosphatase 7 long form homolog [Rhododendron vialii]|uniref:serine/threonine-protein phosphatase 7 long form homolog n=1 Tax=Rhododendron vialii TaxID=182163 RepID=UPI00265EB398|nr:serine/threonine-protein phosphatase 7 long form homolog [Rhododendron vialii]XP_058183610.1 serine/threonine-protein phosphatase 7 long form homolog [Rhododendron vialii]XP_058183611.1 serine/threonine-protein phosphatase 7 long form homolog [Rhododendron vialii]